MIGRYDHGLVALSILVAVLASFVALDLASRVTAARGRKSARYWLAGGAVAMGTGIWAMHFIGMLAFNLPISMSYDIPRTLSSWLIAALASGLALHTASQAHLSLRRLLTAGVTMGIGISCMHFVGMEAMRMQPGISYDPVYFSVSVLIAIAASTAAMWIAFQLRLETFLSAFWKKSLGALIMGAGIVGVHYTGMAAAHFALGSICAVTPQAIDNTWLAGTIAAVTIAFLLTTLIASVYVAIRPTIRSRLFFLVAGCVLPVSILAVGFMFYDYHRGQAQLIANSIFTARSMIAVVDKDLASVESGLRVLTTSRLLMTKNYAEFYRQAQDTLAVLNANAIMLSDANGQQLIDTRRPYGESLPLYDNPPLARRVFQTGRSVLSDFYIGNLNREPLITIGVPVRRGEVIDHQVSGTLLSERLSKILVQQKLPADWIVAIYDSTGTIVARTHEMERFVGKKGAPRVLQRLAQISEGSTDAKTLEGISVISAFSRSPTSKWTVAIGIPIQYFTTGLLGTLKWLLLGIIVLLLSSLALAWVIGTSIARSIHALTEPALALGSGASVNVPQLGLVEADEVGRALTKASDILRQAQHEAQHDVLTGLANRALFNQIVLQQMAVSKRISGTLAVLYIDLDGFKAVNDTHGHPVGDELLKAVAQRIQANIRDCDLAARLGGDEFAVVLIQPGQKGTALVAGKLVESLAGSFSVGTLTLDISASIGAALYPDSAKTHEDLLNQADDAMYQAKKMGKRRFVIASI